jgi:ketosteroid isomerase-like protein
MPTLRSLATLAFATGVAACAAPAPAAPPKADPAAIEAEIKAKVASWNEFIAARNDSAIGELYAADGVLMPPNQPRVAGKDAIRAWFAGMWAISPKMVITTTQVVPSDAGDVAIEEGTFALEFAGADGRPINDTGKYLVIWRKTDAGWKVVRDIFNTDLPPAPPPAAK